MKPTKSATFQKSFSKKSFSDAIFSILIFAVMLIVILNPEKFSSGTISGLSLFITNVLPGLFPFMFLTKLLTELGFVFLVSKKCEKFSNAVFKTPGVSLYAFLMSIISGYPIGAKIISDLYVKEQISETDAKKMSVFCTTSGPAFVIGTVGVTMFGNFKLGIILYLSHIISSLIMGIIYGRITQQNRKKSNINFEISSSSNIIPSCLTDTINSIFTVGAYITLFYLVGEIFDLLQITESLANALYFCLKPLSVSKQECQSLVYGLIEVTRGCKNFANLNSFLSIALCSGIISFSGFSIVMQSMFFLKNAKIKMHSFVLTKLVHLILSSFLCLLMLIVFM